MSPDLSPRSVNVIRDNSYDNMVRRSLNVYNLSNNSSQNKYNVRPKHMKNARKKKKARVKTVIIQIIAPVLDWY